jgi:hypothetical protein
MDFQDDDVVGGNLPITGRIAYMVATTSWLGMTYNAMGQQTFTIKVSPCR